MLNHDAIWLIKGLEDKIKALEEKVRQLESRVYSDGK